MRKKQHVLRSEFEIALMYVLLGEEKTCRKSPSDISLCSWTGGEQHGKDVRRGRLLTACGRRGREGIKTISSLVLLL